MEFLTYLCMFCALTFVVQLWVLNSNLSDIVKQLKRLADIYQDKYTDPAIYEEGEEE